MQRQPKRARGVCACSLSACLSSALLALFSLWIGGLGGMALSARINATRAAAAGASLIVAASTHAPPSSAAPSGLRAGGRAAPSSPLAAALVRSSSLTQFLPNERASLVRHTMRITGHPPLVCRNDATATGDPDFDSFGIPSTIPTPSFLFVDPWATPDAQAGELGGETDPKGHVDSPLYSVTRSEDAIRDIVIAMLASKGHARPKAGDGDGGKTALTCKAGPPTSAFACIASLREQQPQLFAADGTPLPAEAGGPLVLDIGTTAAGYFGVLAGSSASVSSLIIDTQPQCVLWGTTSAAASGVSHLMRMVTAIPLPPNSVPHAQSVEGVPSVQGRVRTGCVGSSTAELPPSFSAVQAFYDTVSPPLANSDAPDDNGRALAESSRKHTGTIGLSSLGGVGGSDLVPIPVATVDDILCATYGGRMCSSGGGAAPTPTILLAKIDARGRTDDVLAGMTHILSNSATRPRNLLIELSKQHTAAALGLPTALSAADSAKSPFTPGSTANDVFTTGYGLPYFTLDEADNTVVAKVFENLARSLLKQGYEVLVSDRGWWAAQEPFSSRHLEAATAALLDGTTLESWAEKLSLRTEVDLWAYIP